MELLRRKIMKSENLEVKFKILKEILDYPLKMPRDWQKNLMIIETNSETQHRK